MEIITMNIVNEKERINFLHDMLGNYSLKFENLVFRIAETMSKDYKGGFWDFCKLDNGGFYCRPESSHMYNCINIARKEANLSADAFGLLVSIAAFSEVANIAFMRNHDNGTLVKYYFQTRNYVFQHSEQAAIFKLMD